MTCQSYHDVKSTFPITNVIHCKGPQKVDDLPSYPGFERDVFRVVKEYFHGLGEPLMTYEMYEVILNVYSESLSSLFLSAL